VSKHLTKIAFDGHLAARPDPVSRRSRRATKGQIMLHTADNVIAFPSAVARAAASGHTETLMSMAFSENAQVAAEAQAAICRQFPSLGITFTR